VFERCCETACIAHEARGETVAWARRTIERETADVANEPVFADADHQQKDEADGDADYDADNDGEQETFTRHRRQQRRPISRAKSFSFIIRSPASSSVPPYFSVHPLLEAPRGNTGGHPLCERASVRVPRRPYYPHRARAGDAFHCEPRRRATPGS